MSGFADQALDLLLRELKAQNYSFITPTPATHARVLAHKEPIAKDLRDIFGWSLPFRAETLHPAMFAMLRDGGGLDERGDLFASRVRISTLGDDLLLHSAYPTTQSDAVFFGPDSYRFAAFLREEVSKLWPRFHLLDIGSGSGVGAITAAYALAGSPDLLVTLVDVNRAALRLSAINWMVSSAPGNVFFINADGLSKERPNASAPDLIIANPPYIADPLHRAYRDGGAMHGAALSLDWAKKAAAKLEKSGAFLLYTGSAIVNGEDPFKAALLEVLTDFDVSYRELDPDVFGEELERDDYAGVERIAVVGVVATKR